MILTRQLTGVVPQVRRVRDLVPVHVESALTRALAKLKADRFRTVKEFAESVGLPVAGAPGRIPAIPGQSRSRSWHRGLPAAGVATGALLLLLFGLDVGGVRTSVLRKAAVPAAAVEGRRSVAVLPFENVGDDPQDEYFADGLSEELIAALSHIRSVRVAARTSAFQFEGHAGDVREIARALNVGTVLVGSVRKSGDRIRVTAQLIDGVNGLAVWSEQYDERSVLDIFDIQENLALRITRALEATLSPSERERIARQPTENFEAYTLYLKGRYAWDRRGEGLFTAIQYFNQAIALDSQFARAYAGLASAYPPLGVLGHIDPREGRARMREAVSRAIELDEGLAEARTARAAYLQVYEWDWEAAELEYRRAIGLDPDYPTAHFWFATLLSRIGRHREAEDARRRSAELDPLAPLSALPRAAVDSVARAALARSLALAGREPEARDIIEVLRAEAASTGVHNPAVATALAALGDVHAVVEWLEQSERQRHPALACHSGPGRLCTGSVDVVRQLAAAFDDPRLDDLLVRMGLER